MEALPFSEPPWLNGHPSPYYNDSHREWQHFCRQYISENLTKYAMQWENEGAIPDDIYRCFPSNECCYGIPSLTLSRTILQGQYAHTKPSRSVTCKLVETSGHRKDRSGKPAQRYNEGSKPSTSYFDLWRCKEFMDALS